MAEDWNAVAAEVEDALRSIGDISEPDGHPAVIRQQTGEQVNPWDPPGGEITYAEVRVLISDDRLRDISGTLIDQTLRTVTISGANDVVPHDNDKIALGMTVAEVQAAGDDNVAWQGISTVRPLAPAGVAVLYELDLST